MSFKALSWLTLVFTLSNLIMNFGYAGDPPPLLKGQFSATYHPSSSPGTADATPDHLILEKILPLLNTASVATLSQTCKGFQELTATELRRRRVNRFFNGFLYYLSSFMPLRADQINELIQLDLTREELKGFLPLLKQENAQVRSNAISALSKIRPSFPEIHNALIEVGMNDINMEVVKSAIKALRRMKPWDPVIHQKLAQLMLQSSSKTVRINAAQALADFQPTHPEVIRNLVWAFKNDESSRVRSAAGLALGESISPSLSKHLGHHFVAHTSAILIGLGLLPIDLSLYSL